MANKSQFKSPRPKAKKPVKPVATVRNAAGGRAYKLEDEDAAAQIAVTGTFNGTFYTSGEDQLKKFQEVLGGCDPEFLAKLAVYSRTQGFMKDSPAVIMATLAARKDLKSLQLLKTVFPKVIDNGKMLRNFVQVVRSGVTGRSNFGTAIKHQLAGWFDGRSAEDIFKQSVGNDPTLKDVLRLSRYKPDVRSLEGRQKEAVLQTILGKPYEAKDLPGLLKEFNKFKANPEAWEGPLPKVPFEMLTGMPLTASNWLSLAMNGGWTFLRMNINTFERHGLLKNDKFVRDLCRRLRDPKEIERARAFPYQILMSAVATKPSGYADPKTLIASALEDALELAVNNVPAFGGKVVVCPDVSGSMQSAITGVRKGSTSDVRCIDVAGLVAASVIRKNPEAICLPFDDRVHDRHAFSNRDSVMSIAKALAAYGGGGTDCSRPLEWLVANKIWPDLILYVSDNESWIDRWLSGRTRYSGGRMTPTNSQTLWETIVKHNPRAKMVCIDIQPNTTTQVQSDRKNVLNIGGFSDRVWDAIKIWTGDDGGNWRDVINATKL